MTAALATVDLSTWLAQERLVAPRPGEVRLTLPRARRDFRCDPCGYGAVGLTPPSRCPMCGRADWSAV